MWCDVVLKCVLIVFVQVIRQTVASNKRLNSIEIADFRDGWTLQVFFLIERRTWNNVNRRFCIFIIRWNVSFYWKVVNLVETEFVNLIFFLKKKHKFLCIESVYSLVFKKWMEEEKNYLLMRSVRKTFENGMWIHIEYKESVFFTKQVFCLVYRSTNPPLQSRNV